MILAKSGDKLRSLKNYLGLALSVRATISDSKSDFHKEFPYVIPEHHKHSCIPIEALAPSMNKTPDRRVPISLPAAFAM